MKPTTINVQITKCPKQYEAVRLGLEATLDPGDTVENAIKEATAQLNAIYVEMYQQGTKAPQTPQKAPSTAKKEEKQESAQPEPLNFGDTRLRQVAARIEKAATAQLARIEKADTLQLNAIYEEMYQQGTKAPQTPQKSPTNETEAQAQAQAQEQKRELLKFEDPRLQQIVVRIEKAAGDPNKIKAILENVYKYFAPDAVAEQIIALAAKLNN